MFGLMPSSVVVAVPIEHIATLVRLFYARIFGAMIAPLDQSVIHRGAEREHQLNVCLRR